MRAALVIPLCALFIGTSVLPLRAAAEAPAGQACSFLLELHAMLTRAQMQCGFGRYNQALIDKAAVCARALPEAELKATMMKGFTAFDASAKAGGKAGVCAELLRQFPQFVRR